MITPGTPLMHSLAIELASQTEEISNMRAASSGLSFPTSPPNAEPKPATGPGKILQVSAAGLAASSSTQTTDSTALVGSNKPYAAVMQFGGDQADFPQLWGDIPGRPCLPMDAEGNLQPDAEGAILN